MTFTSPSPTCTIPFARCSQMWQGYLLSLGITTPLDKATEPAITPMPSNRPRCSIGDPSVTYTGATWDNTCFISGNSVGLFYWPSATASGGLPTPAPNITAAPVTVVRGNLTFTSPSVYLSFDTLSAIQGHDADQISYSQSVPLGASTQPENLVGGFYPETVGPTFTNVLISLHPTKLSSVIANLGPGVNTASAISEIAHGGPDYAKWISALKDSRPVPTANNSYLIRPVNYAHLTMPHTDDYYLQPNIAPGCFNPHGPHPGCSTMFEGAYRAQLLVPEEVRALAPEWKGCGIPLDGVYDPPQALTAAKNEAKPTMPMPMPDAAEASAVKDPISGSAKPKSSVGDPLPEVTATPEPQPKPDPKPTEQKSVEEGDPTLSQGTPTRPSRAYDSHPQSSPDPVPSVTGDPVQPSASARSSEQAPDPGSLDSVTAIMGSQTFAIPAPKASTDDPKPDESNPVNTDVPGPTNALSVLAAAESTARGPAQSSPSMAAVASLSDSTIAVIRPQHEIGAETIGTATLSPGGPAATINGQEVSAGSDGIVVDPKTLPYATYQLVNKPPPGTPTVAAVLPLGSSSMVVSSPTGADRAVIVGSTTLKPGAPAVTIDGHQVSAASNGIMVDSQMVYYSTMDDSASPAATSAGVAVVTAGGHTFSIHQADGPGSVVVDGQILTYGSSATTISGQMISVGRNALVVGSQTVSFSDAVESTPSITELRPGIFVYGDRTLTAGGWAATESGRVVSAMASGVVVGGTTLSPDVTATSSTSSHSTSTHRTTSTTIDPSNTSTVPSVSPTTSESAASRMGFCLTDLLGVLVIAIVL